MYSLPSGEGLGILNRKNTTVARSLLHAPLPMINMVG